MRVLARGQQEQLPPKPIQLRLPPALARGLHGRQRLLGEIAVRRESPERASAETYYRQSLTLAEELGMRPLQAHCHRGLGMLYATTSQQEQARTALTTASTMYRAMAMTFWLPETEAALAHVEGQSSM